MWVRAQLLGVWMRAWMSYDDIYHDGAMVLFSDDALFRFVPWSSIQID